MAPAVAGDGDFVGGRLVPGQQDNIGSVARAVAIATVSFLGAWGIHRIGFSHLKPRHPDFASADAAHALRAVLTQLIGVGLEVAVNAKATLIRCVHSRLIC